MLRPCTHVAMRGLAFATCQEPGPLLCCACTREALPACFAPGRLVPAGGPPPRGALLRRAAARRGSRRCAPAARLATLQLPAAGCPLSISRHPVSLRHPSAPPSGRARRAPAAAPPRARACKALRLCSCRHARLAFVPGDARGRRMAACRRVLGAALRRTGGGAYWPSAAPPLHTQASGLSCRHSSQLGLTGAGFAPSGRVGCTYSYPTDALAAGRERRGPSMAPGCWGACA